MPDSQPPQPPYQPPQPPYQPPQPPYQPSQPPFQPPRPPFKPPVVGAEASHVTAIDISMHQLLDHLVERVPGVSAALVASADGLVLASHLPPGTGFDPASIAAMSAAALALSNRLVQLAGPSPVSYAHYRSHDGQVFVFGVAHVAVLTVLAGPTASPSRIQQVGPEIGRGIERLFRGTADV